MPDLDDIVDGYMNDWRRFDWVRWPGYEFIGMKAEMINIAFRWWGHQYLYNREELRDVACTQAGFNAITYCDHGESEHQDLMNLEMRSRFQAYYGGDQNRCVRSGSKIISTFGARTYSTAIELATLLVTARILGPDGRGIVATTLAWASFFAAIFGLSLGQVIVHRLTGNEKKDQLHIIFSALLPVSFFLVLAGWLCSYIVYFQLESGGLKALPEGIAVMLGFSLIPLIMWDTYCSHLLSASRRLHIYNKGLILGRTVGFGVMLSAILLFGWEHTAQYLAA